MIVCFKGCYVSMPKDNGYEGSQTVSRRQYTFMSAEDLAAGKKSSWYELEITGMV